MNPQALCLRMTVRVLLLHLAITLTQQLKHLSNQSSPPSAQPHQANHSSRMLLHSFFLMLLLDRDIIKYIVKQNNLKTYSVLVTSGTLLRVISGALIFVNDFSQKGEMYPSNTLLKISIQTVRRRTSQYGLSI